MKSNVNLLEGDLHPIFFKYLISSISGMLGTSLYILADTLFVANGIGEVGLASLNISIPMMNMFNGLGLLFGIGGATALAISKGQKKNDQIDQIFTLSIALSLLMGIIFTIMGAFYIEEIILFMGASAETLEMSKDYLGVIMAFSIAFLLNTTLTVFVRNDGAPSLAMWGMLAGTISNIILDYIFIFIFNWGMWGAAFATAISPIISLCILATHFIKKNNMIKLQIPKLNKKIIERIFLNGASSFITEFSAGVVIFAFNIAILQLIGDIGVAAYGIIANLSLVCSSIFTGIGQAIQPIISMNYGAQKKDRVNQVIKLGLIVATVLGIVFFAIGIIFPELLTAMFNRDSNMQLANITVNGIYLYFIAFIFMGINIVMVSYLQSIEKSKIATIISFARGLIFIIIGLTILTKIFGINGVWLTMPFVEVITLLLSLILFKSYRYPLSKSIKSVLRGVKHHINY